MITTSLQTAINCAERLAAETEHTQYVVGNGMGQYWVTEKLAIIPMSGLPVRPHVICAPGQDPQWTRGLA